MLSAEFERMKREGGIEAMRMADRLGIANPFFVPSEDTCKVESVFLEPAILTEEMSRGWIEKLWKILVNGVEVGFITYHRKGGEQIQGCILGGFNENVYMEDNVRRRELVNIVERLRWRGQYRSVTTLILHMLGRAGLDVTPPVPVSFGRKSTDVWEWV